MDFKDRKEIIKTVLYRLLPSLLVFILALLAFNNGVYLEDKPNICTDSLFVQIYYTIGLFLLAGTTGFLKLVNFNNDSEGNQIFSFKID